MNYTDNNSRVLSSQINKNNHKLKIHKLQTQLTPSINAHLSAEQSCLIHPDPIWNNGAIFSFFLKSIAPTTKRTTTVPDLKITTDSSNFKFRHKMQTSVLKFEFSNIISHLCPNKCTLELFAGENYKQPFMTQTFTYSFSCTFRPFTRSTHACVSKSIVSTWIDNIVRTLLLELLPVDDSVSTFLTTQQFNTTVLYNITSKHTLAHLSNSVFLGVSWKHLCLHSTEDDILAC